MSIDLNSAWAVVDVETSGLDPRRDRVLSVAVITLDPARREQRRWSTLLNPGVDPGPVHVHGLTREVLAGAPRFEEVAATLSTLIAGRVLVAHNASFDLGFLSQEAARCGLELGHTQVLDTLRMARSLGLGLSSLSLGSLAAAFGVRQERAHDALDDTRVLSEVFRELLSRAEQGSKPVYALGERAPRPPSAPRSARSGVKTPCAFLNPGRWHPGAPLVQGMRVAFSGGDPSERAALEARTSAAGLDVSSSVSARTSVLVCDAESAAPSSKLLRARELGCSVISIAEYAELIEAVDSGVEVSS